MTWASIPWPCSSRANQNPSRPDSYATTVRVIVRPARVVSLRHRSTCSNRRVGLTGNFCSRSTPGTVAATSQELPLISITHTSVLSWSRATRGLDRSYGLVMGLLHQCQRNEGASDLVARPIASFAHDGTERRIVRPQNPAEQTECYSGK